MKKKYYAMGALSIVLITASIWLGPKLRELNALKNYASTFEADKIDENFRSLYQINPSIVIPKPAVSFPLTDAENAQVFPQSYDFYGDQRTVDDFLQRTHTTGIMVIHDNQVVYENYFRGNQRESQVLMASVSKGMASMLVGVAVADGDIDIDKPVTEYAKRLTGSAYDNVSVRQVLNMSTGIKWSEDYGDFDSEIVRSLVAMTLGSLDDFAATMQTDHAPGTERLYASINTHILGMVIRGATGRSYQDYFYQKLWSQLGAEDDVQMLVDSVGEPLVFGGVNIRLRDMARFGLLYLNEGRNLEGKQVVPKTWVRRSSIPDAEYLKPIDKGNTMDTRFGYANHWWLPPTQDGDDFTGIGIYGQFLYVNPQRKVVIAKTSAYADYLNTGGEMQLESFIAFQAIARHLYQQSVASE